MKTIFYNSAVATLCGTNGIIKAVLLNYIYNYHKPARNRGAGYPARIALAEFVYQYMHEDLRLWKRSFIHKMLKQLQRHGYLHVEPDKQNRPVFSVSEEIADLLRDGNATRVSFDLELACRSNIYIAIVSRFILHVIDHSPGGIAYNLDVKEMSKVNRISVSEIYRIIAGLERVEVVKRVKSPLKHKSRGLHLARF